MGEAVALKLYTQFSSKPVAFLEAKLPFWTGNRVYTQFSSKPVAFPEAKLPFWTGDKI